MSYELGMILAFALGFGVPALVYSVVQCVKGGGSNG